MDFFNIEKTVKTSSNAFSDNYEVQLVLEEPHYIYGWGYGSDTYAFSSFTDPYSKTYPSDLNYFNVLGIDGYGVGLGLESTKGETFISHGPNYYVSGAIYPEDVNGIYYDQNIPSNAYGYSYPISNFYVHENGKYSITLDDFSSVISRRQCVITDNFSNCFYSTGIKETVLNAIDDTVTIQLVDVNNVAITMSSDEKSFFSVNQKYKYFYTHLFEPTISVDLYDFKKLIMNIYRSDIPNEGEEMQLFAFFTWGDNIEDLDYKTEIASPISYNTEDLIVTNTGDNQTSLIWRVYHGAGPGNEDEQSIFEWDSNRSIKGKYVRFVLMSQIRVATAPWTAEGTVAITPYNASSFTYDEIKYEQSVQTDYLEVGSWKGDITVTNLYATANDTMSYGWGYEQTPFLASGLVDNVDILAYVYKNGVLCTGEAIEVSFECGPGVTLSAKKATTSAGIATVNVKVDSSAMRNVDDVGGDPEYISRLSNGFLDITAYANNNYNPNDKNTTILTISNVVFDNDAIVSFTIGTHGYAYGYGF